MKLCVFDFDSTLMDGETIDFLAKEMNVSREVEIITTRAMQGDLDFFESLTTRVSLLEGLNAKKARDICHNLPLMNGARETIKELKSRGYTVVVFSGGFKIATSYYKNILNYDADFSNILHHNKAGNLSGNVGGDMMFGFSKGDMIQNLQSLLGVDRTNTLVIGDGANDISMFKHSDTRVAFCAKEILKKEANIIVDTKDLTLLLDKV